MELINVSTEAPIPTHLQSLAFVILFRMNLDAFSIDLFTLACSSHKAICRVCGKQI